MGRPKGSKNKPSQFSNPVSFSGCTNPSQREIFIRFFRPPTDVPTPPLSQALTIDQPSLSPNNNAQFNAPQLPSVQASSLEDSLNVDPYRLRSADAHAYYASPTHQENFDGEVTRDLGITDQRSEGGIDAISVGFDDPLETASFEDLGLEESFAEDEASPVAIHGHVPTVPSATRDIGDDHPQAPAPPGEIDSEEDVSQTSAASAPDYRAESDLPRHQSHAVEFVQETMSVAALFHEPTMKCGQSIIPHSHPNAVSLSKVTHELNSAMREMRVTHPRLDQPFRLPPDFPLSIRHHANSKDVTEEGFRLLPGRFDWRKILTGEELVEGQPNPPALSFDLQMEESKITTDKLKTLISKCVFKWDVDSTILLPKTLGIVKGPMHLQLAPRHSESLKEQQKVQVEWANGSDLKLVRHVYLGYPDMQANAKIYILFPYLPKSGKGQTGHMPEHWIEMWYNQIFSPAYREATGSDYTLRQHLSASSYGQSKAKGGSKADAAGGYAVRQNVSERYLDKLWENIVRRAEVTRIRDGGIAEFSKPKLLIINHGTKEDGSKGDSIRDTFQKNMGLMQKSFKMEAEYIDRSGYWVDLGMEIVLPPITDESGSTYTMLHKTNCQNSKIKHWEQCQRESEHLERGRGDSDSDSETTVSNLSSRELSPESIGSGDDGMDRVHAPIDALTATQAYTKRKRDAPKSVNQRPGDRPNKRQKRKKEFKFTMKQFSLMLAADVTSITVKVPRKSRLSKGGVLDLKSYNSFKELAATPMARGNTTEKLQKRDLDLLGLENHTLATLLRTKPGQHIGAEQHQKTLSKNFFDGLAFYDAIWNDEEPSKQNANYGLRWELRLTFECFRAVAQDPKTLSAEQSRRLLRHFLERLDTEDEEARLHLAFWILPTDVLVAYLKANTNRWALVAMSAIQSAEKMEDVEGATPRLYFPLTSSAFQMLRAELYSNALDERALFLGATRKGDTLGVGLDQKRVLRQYGMPWLPQFMPTAKNRKNQDRKVQLVLNDNGTPVINPEVARDLAVYRTSWESTVQDASNIHNKVTIHNERKALEETLRDLIQRHRKIQHESRKLAEKASLRELAEIVAQVCVQKYNHWMWQRVFHATADFMNELAEERYRVDVKTYGGDAPEWGQIGEDVTMGYTCLGGGQLAYYITKALEAKQNQDEDSTKIPDYKLPVVALGAAGKAVEYCEYHQTGCWTDRVMSIFDWDRDLEGQQRSEQPLWKESLFPFRKFFVMAREFVKTTKLLVFLDNDVKESDFLDAFKNHATANMWIALHFSKKEPFVRIKKAANKLQQLQFVAPCLTDETRKRFPSLKDEPFGLYNPHTGKKIETTDPQSKAIMTNGNEEAREHAKFKEQVQKENLRIFATKPSAKRAEPTYIPGGHFTSLKYAVFFNERAEAIRAGKGVENSDSELDDEERLSDEDTSSDS